MPRLRQVVPDLIDLGGDVLGTINARRTASQAGQALTGGIDSAGQRITNATGTAIAGEQDALNRQQGLYADRRNALAGGLAEQQNIATTRRNDFQPYATAGQGGVTALSDLVKENPQFDVSQVEKDPGYAFGRDEGAKEVQRILSARGTLNSGQVKGLIRYANDYATTKVNDSFNRFTTGQDQRLARINALTGVGEQAAAGQSAASGDLANQVGTEAGRVSDAAGEFGDQIGRSATNRSALTLGEANALGNLDLSRAEVGANVATNQGNSSQGLIRDIASTGVGLLKKAVGIGGAAAGAAGTVAGIAAPSAAAVAATTAQMASLGIGTAAAPATATAAGGGLGSTLASLATNPITIGVAAALAVGAVWLKSQAHWEANTAVKDFENPFHQNSLAPFAAQWDKAIKGGQVTAAQGHASLDQYIQNFQDYTDKIEQWAGASKDKKKVAEQSVNNLMNTTVRPQIERMQREIASLPLAPA